MNLNLPMVFRAGSSLGLSLTVVVDVDVGVGGTLGARFKSGFRYGGIMGLQGEVSK